MVEIRHREAGLNRYHGLKGAIIGVALCVAIFGSTLGTANLHPHFAHSPYTAADTMQAGIYHAGASLGHMALKLFYFGR
jgi:hypothetical protein